MQRGLLENGPEALVHHRRERAEGILREVDRGGGYRNEKGVAIVVVEVFVIGGLGLDLPTPFVAPPRFF